MKRIDLLVKNYKPNSKDDKLKEKLEEFQSSAAPKVEAMVENLEHLQERTSKLAKMYGEPSGKTKWDTLFNIFADFADLYSRAEKNLARAKLVAEKEQQRKDREERRKQVSWEEMEVRSAVLTRGL